MTTTAELCFLELPPAIVGLRPSTYSLPATFMVAPCCAGSVGLSGFCALHGVRGNAKFELRLNVNNGTSAAAVMTHEATLREGLASFVSSKRWCYTSGCHVARDRKPKCASLVNAQRSASF